MDINLGTVGISANQRMRMHLLQDENIRSFRAEGDVNPEITVTVVEELTQEEKDQLTLELLTLEDTPFVNPHEQDKIDFKLSHPFFNLSPLQAADWIEANVAGIDLSAKSALKEMAKAIATLIRGTDINQ